jgi:hypothetical protein
VARQARYLELTTYPRFSRRFADAMLFAKESDSTVAQNDGL